MAGVQDITIEKNLQFGVHDGEPLTADFYAPKGNGIHPALVAVHGGGWPFATSGIYDHWGPYLAKQGYAVFSINYRLVQGEKNRYPSAVNDTRAAVQFVKGKAEEMALDSNRIGLIGDSAGAHLASLVALNGDGPAFAGAYPDDPYANLSTRVKAVVGVYGVYDLMAQWSHDQVNRPGDQITEKLLGKSPIESKQAFYEASPLTYTTLENNDTAFLVVWGTEDDIADPHTQSESFVVALKQARFFVRTAVVPLAPHYWMSDPIDESTSYSGFLAPRLTRFLQDKL